jgi:(R,R)-butanediol dehydrogenase/meso-butanediol dehydrogenase/diacetyl reductase
MKATITKEGGGFEVVTLPDPSPEADQLVVKVVACGVCGSDLKAHTFVPCGTVMGHELCGEVVAVGREAGAWREGAHVAILPVVSCGTCENCKSGDVAHCSLVRFIGMGADGGGFAEFAAVPAKHAFPLPEHISPVVGALVEPFAVGLHGAAAGEVGPGSQVLVVGAGGVGLTTVAWARALGAERVTVADPLASRLELARTLGATDVLPSAAEATYNGYDTVVECVGRPELLDMCIAATRPRGRIVMAGACEHDTTFMPIMALLKEVTIRFSVAYRPDEFRRVVDAFSTNLIDPGQVLGPRVGLHQVADAFEQVRTSATQGRVLVVPNL